MPIPITLVRMNDFKAPGSGAGRVQEPASVRDEDDPLTLQQTIAIKEAFRGKKETYDYKIPSGWQKVEKDHFSIKFCWMGKQNQVQASITLAKECLPVGGLKALFESRLEKHKDLVVKKGEGTHNGLDLKWFSCEYNGIKIDRFFYHSALKNEGYEIECVCLEGDYKRYSSIFNEFQASFRLVYT